MSRYEPHWDSAYRYVIWETVEDDVPQMPPIDLGATKNIRPNREQRRRILRQRKRANHDQTRHANQA